MTSSSNPTRSGRGESELFPANFPTTTTTMQIASDLHKLFVFLFRYFWYFVICLPIVTFNVIHCMAGGPLYNMHNRDTPVGANRQRAHRQYR